MDFRYDKNGDIKLTNGLIHLEKQIENLTRSRLSIRLHCNKGEWKFNIEFGLPWIVEGSGEQLLGKFDKNYVDGVIKKTIMEQDHVVEILDYYSVIDSRNRLNTIKCSVRTEYGDIITLNLED